MMKTALKVVKALLITKNEQISHLARNIAIILLSPIIGLMFLIGGIFSDGIEFNHGFVDDLISGNSINLSEYTAEQIQYIESIQNGLVLIDEAITTVQTTSMMESETLDQLQIKGYYIGLMLSEQSISLTSDSAVSFVEAFTTIIEDETPKEETAEIEENNGVEVEGAEEPKRNRIVCSDFQTIFVQLEETLGVTLLNDTKTMMLNVYSGVLNTDLDSYIVDPLSQYEIMTLLNNLPEGTSELRRNIVKFCADSVGKIPYYWGGHASTTGYDGNNFGMIITADEHGRVRRGLDCSHYVDWVFWTLLDNNLGQVGATAQMNRSRRISKDELLPGDLGFLVEGEYATHVGIYVGTNENGELLWIHENAADENVALNSVTYWNAYGRLDIMEGK